MKLMSMNYAPIWYDLVGELEDEIREDVTRRWPGRNPHQAEFEALGRYKLACFAARIARDPRALWAHLSDNEALNLYLINKHHWAPDLTANLTPGDYLYLLRDELMEMKLTTDESNPIRQTFAHSPSALLEIAPHFD